jgi:hypothetical protein
MRANSILFAEALSAALTIQAVSIPAAFAFEPDQVFVGTANSVVDDSQIYRLLPDGTTSVFASDISGAIRALEFDPTQTFLYALIIREGDMSSRRVVRYMADGTSELFADLAQVQAASGSGDTDIEIDQLGRVFVTTSTQRVVELLGGPLGVERFTGPISSVYHAIELSRTEGAFVGNRGGDVIRLDSDFRNPTTFAHVPLSHPEIDFQAIDSDSAGNLVALVQDFSTSANIYRIDAAGTVTPFAKIDGQGGKLAVGSGDDVYAVALSNVVIFDRHGTIKNTVPFSRQLDGIALVRRPIPEPSGFVILAILLCFPCALRNRNAK